MKPCSVNGTKFFYFEACKQKCSPNSFPPVTENGYVKAWLWLQDAPRGATSFCRAPRFHWQGLAMLEEDNLSCSPAHFCARVCQTNRLKLLKKRCSFCGREWRTCHCGPEPSVRHRFPDFPEPVYLDGLQEYEEQSNVLNVDPRLVPLDDMPVSHRVLSQFVLF